MMDQFVALIFTNNNPSLFPEEMIIKSKYGIISRGGASLPSWDILTTSEPPCFIMSIHGSCPLVMIRQSGFGIGNPDNASVC